MIVTTTPAVEGRKIVAYKGIVFGEVVSGVNFIKDMFSSITDMIGGRSGNRGRCAQPVSYTHLTLPTTSRV